MTPEAIAGLEIAKANSSLSYEAFLLASALAAALPEEDGKMRTDRANAMDHILEKIRGAKFGVSAEVMAQAEEVYAEDIAALEAQFGLRFSRPQTVVSAPVWGPETLTDIVQRMDRIQLENEYYRRVVKDLRAKLAERE